jgi:hypothetical protein
VLLHAGEPADPEREQAELVLEPAELALYRAALAVVGLEPVGLAGEQRVQP